MEVMGVISAGLGCKVAWLSGLRYHLHYQRAGWFFSHVLICPNLVNAVDCSGFLKKVC
jgi:hypothetical protein